ncbi:hypothetical protein GQ600_27933 [Phytophthora cactorum]|nr:hypothetical protein GQ600_27933 [Phytophthora cactorum]
MTNRIGFAESIKEKKRKTKTRSKHIMRRAFTYARSHQYIRKLHLELINLKDEDMYEGNTFGAGGTPLGQDTTSSDGGTLAERVVHSAKPIDDWRNHSGQLKRVQRNCKECSLLRTDRKRGGTTTYFCDVWFSSLPVYLCMKPKHTMDEELRSC